MYVNLEDVYLIWVFLFNFNLNLGNISGFMGYWDDNKEFEFLFLNGIFFVLNLS